MLKWRIVDYVTATTPIRVFKELRNTMVIETQKHFCYGRESFNPELGDKITLMMELNALDSGYGKGSGNYDIITLKDIDKIPESEMMLIVPDANGSSGARQTSADWEESKKHVPELAELSKNVYDVMHKVMPELYNMNILFSSSTIMTKHPKVFEEVRRQFKIPLITQFKTLKNPRVEKMLSNTMDHMIEEMKNFQRKITRFEATNPTKQDWDKFFVTKEQYQAHLEGVVEFDKVLYEVLKASKVEGFYDGFKTRPDLNWMLEKLKDAIQQIESAKTSPYLESNIDWDFFGNYFNVEQPDYSPECPEYHNIINFKDVAKREVMRMVQYTILTHNYYMICHYSGTMMYDKPDHWFAWKKKFEALYGQTQEVIKRVAKATDIDTHLFGAIGYANWAFESYMWDEELVEGYAERGNIWYNKVELTMYEFIRDGVIDYTILNMQNLFADRFDSFIEDYLIPYALEQLAKYGKEVILSRTCFYDLDTGECTRTRVTIDNAATSQILKDFKAHKTIYQMEGATILTARQPFKPKEETKVLTQREEDLAKLKELSLAAGKAIELMRRQNPQEYEAKRKEAMGEFYKPYNPNSYNKFADYTIKELGGKPEKPKLKSKPNSNNSDKDSGQSDDRKPKLKGK